MAKIYDITRTVAPDLKVWPGDTPFSLQHVLRLDAGDNVNLTTLTMSAHTGTHADAPYHYEPNGEFIDGVPLDKYIGPSHVATITRQHGGIVPADFADHDLAGMQRLLIHTWVSDLPDTQWPDDFPYPTLELIDWLAQQGAVLLGVDLPSVDRFDDANVPCHLRLYQRGIVNLETLFLRDIPDGIYELIALPLKLKGACGSPVRAVLRINT
jgi:arylformamidase